MSTETSVARPERYRILLVDDEAPARRLEHDVLERAGFEVWPAESGQDALELIERRGLPHLAIVDILMPGMSGVEFGTKIHEFVDLPIIMLTGVDDKDVVVDTLRNLAEDYITKPFTPGELVARVERLLKRIGDFSYTLEPRIRVDERLELELGRRMAYVNGREIELTPTETKLLHILMRNAGHTTLSQTLIQRLWPLEEVFEDTLRTHIYRLRRKIEPPRGKPRYVITKRGFGYTFPVSSRT